MERQCLIVPSYWYVLKCDAPSIFKGRWLVMEVINPTTFLFAMTNLEEEPVDDDAALAADMRAHTAGKRMAGDQHSWNLASGPRAGTVEVIRS